jgi:hypothetical protein
MNHHHFATILVAPGSALEALCAPLAGDLELSASTFLLKLALKQRIRSMLKISRVGNWSCLRHIRGL